MSMRTMGAILLALLCGAGVAVGVTRVGPSTPMSSGLRAQATSVVVAAADVPRGRPLVTEDLAVRDWPAELAPPGTLTKIEEAVGRVANSPLVAGEPLLGSKLATKDAGRGLGSLIPKGMRAYTIQATRVASNVAGFILPGDKVDVLLNLRGTANDETGGGSTTTLLQYIEVLAVDQRLEAPSDNKMNLRELASVTLLVQPSQAAKLDLGQNLGQLTLSLRNPEDDVDANTDPATIREIRLLEEKAPRPRAAATPVAPSADATRAHEKDPARRSIVTLRGPQRGYIWITAQP